jgi:hypothetical protein
LVLPFVVGAAELLVELWSWLWWSSFFKQQLSLELLF